MTILTPSDCRALYRKLDASGQDYFLSEELANRVSAITQSNGLDEDEESQLVLVAGYVVLGALRGQEIERELAERLDGDAKKITKLAEQLRLATEDRGHQPAKDESPAQNPTGPAPVRLDMLQPKKEVVAPERPNFAPQPTPVQPAFSQPPIVPAGGARQQEPLLPPKNYSFTSSPTPPSQPTPTPVAPKVAPSPTAVDLSSLRSAAASVLSAPHGPAAAPSPAPIFIRQENEARPIQMDGRIPTPTQDAAYNNRDQIASLGGNSATSIKEKAGPAAVEFGEHRPTPPLAAAMVPPPPIKNIYGNVAPTAPKPFMTSPETFGSDFSSSIPTPTPTIHPENTVAPKNSFWSSFVDMVSPIKKSSQKATVPSNRVDIAPPPIAPGQETPPPHP